RATRGATEGDFDSQQAGKISKSKGSQPFSQLLEQFSPETIRFFILSTHYRRPIDYSEDRLHEVETGMEAFYRLFKRFQRVTGEDFYGIAAPATRTDGELKPGGDPLLQAAAEHRTKFLEAMDDDFNTGGAIGTLFELARAINKFIEDEKLEDPKRRTAEKLAPVRGAMVVFRELALALGLFRKPPAEKSAAGDNALVGKLMELLIQLRAEARKQKDFATADRIRNGLTEIGVVLEDRPSGTEWSVS
ncbi:MAG: DALR domain-containing protein, partial [Planctomycetota bacterium]